MERQLRSTADAVGAGPAGDSCRYPASDTSHAGAWLAARAETASERADESRSGGDEVRKPHKTGFFSCSAVPKVTDRYHPGSVCGRQAVHFSHPGLLQRRDPLPVHGEQYAEGTVHRHGQGHSGAFPDPRRHPPLRPWQPVHQRRLSGDAGGERPCPESQRRSALLRQRPDGELLRHSEKGTNLPHPGVSDDDGPSQDSGFPVCFRLLQPAEGVHGKSRRPAAGSLQARRPAPGGVAAEICCLRSATLHSYVLSYLRNLLYPVIS